MRLLFITGSLVHGGAERHSIGLVNRLAERGHECHAVYVKNDPSQLGRLQNAASIRCLHGARYLDTRAVSHLASFIERLEPAALVAANPYALMYASLARVAAGSKAPVVVTYHSTVLPTLKERFQMLYYRPLFWSADRVVFLCEAQRRYCSRRLVLGPGMDVIYNGVDLDYWKPGPSARASLGIDEKAFVVGLSAVLRPEKNAAQLVEAVAMLRRRGVNAHALLIGDGPMRPAVEARARELGVSGDVTITGFQQDVRPFVGACDALALCSTAVETFSLAALEAMALGKPVVHSDTGGAAEMVEHGVTGFLFPRGDTPALVERLAALAAPGTAARMGEAARAAVEARFSEQTMVERYERLLARLDAQRRSHDGLRRPARAH